MMQQQNPNQINAEYLLESLKQQRNEATDALAMMHARFAEAAQMNQNLLSIFNDREALIERIAELDAEEAEAEEAEAEEAEEADPKPKPKPKRKPNSRGKALPPAPSGGSSGQRR